MAEKTNDHNKEEIGIPKACHYENIFVPKNERTLNESPDWLTDLGPIPLWSCLKPLNCTGQPREPTKGAEKNFMVEIPGRLLSLFGSDAKQIDCSNKMETMSNIHLMSNLFALCAALKNNFSEWSDKLLDKITTTALSQYPDFLNKHSIKDQEVNINHFNGSFKFDGDEYRTQIMQIATGGLYIPFGLCQFNLARALSWFFNRYQFGFIKCGQHTLAVGRILNNEHDFLLYDCQSRGYPMFVDQQKSPYILRTSYLQVLLYCLLKTFNYAEKMNFIVYNVDITIINPLETRLSQQAINESMTKSSSKNFFEKNAPLNTPLKVQKSIQKKAQNTVPKVAQKITQKSKRDSPLFGKSNSQTANSTKPKLETSSSQDSNKKIILDPNKMYYIVAVPKSGLVTAKIQSKHLILPKSSTSSAKLNEKDQLNREPVKELDVEKLLETIDLEKSASTATLTNEVVEASIIKNPENLGLKVYLVENKGNLDLTDPSSMHKIKVAHQLRDFFKK